MKYTHRGPKSEAQEQRKWSAIKTLVFRKCFKEQNYYVGHDSPRVALIYIIRFIYLDFPISLKKCLREVKGRANTCCGCGFAGFDSGQKYLNCKSLRNYKHAPIPLQSRKNNGGRIKRKKNPQHPQDRKAGVEFPVLFANPTWLGKCTEKTGWPDLERKSSPKLLSHRRRALKQIRNFTLPPLFN